MISAVNPDEPASNFQQRDNALPPSQGHKVSGEDRKTPEGKRRNSHAGGTSDKARTL
jgi:hypothetical protein